MDRGDGADRAVVSRLMLKFRPIAPKPVAKESAMTGSLEASDRQLKHFLAGKVKLPKRKYIRSRKNNVKRASGKRMGKLSRQKKEGGASREEIEEMDVNTLWLLPDKAEEEPIVHRETLTSLSREKPLSFIDSIDGILDMPERSSDIQLSINNHVAVSPLLAPFSLDGLSRFSTGQPSDDFALYLPDQQPSSTSASVDFQLLVQPQELAPKVHIPEVSGSIAVVTVIETVTVDCHATTDSRELGCTDTEIIKNLGLDTSPGFISDSWNKIRWVNGAFRKMVTTVQDPLMEVVAVVLEAKVDELPKRFRAFSGRVRVKLRRDHREGDREEELAEKMSCCKWQQVVPCDVWIMDCGGFAWRLDLKAALTLGRSS